MSVPVILVVEDEESYIDALEVGLAREGFDIKVARTGAEALSVFDSLQPDLIVLDVMLPGISGVDVCREIRSRSDVPIIMVTAKSAEIDIVVGLEVGADDYVTKPYRLRELVARIRSALRRSGSRPPACAELPSESIDIGDVSMNLETREVMVRGEALTLPLKEYELLYFLMDNAGQVINRYKLIERVWGYDYVGDTKTLDVHIKRLRSKIERSPGDPKYILTARGVGYRFVHPASVDQSDGDEPS